MTYSFNHYFNAVKDGATREISLFEIQQSYGLSGDLQPQPYLYYGSGNRLSRSIHGSPLFLSKTSTSFTRRFSTYTAKASRL